MPPRTPLVAAALGAPLLKCSPLPSAIALNLIINPPPLVAVVVPRLIIFKVNSKNATNYAWLEFGERFLPIPTTTLTKRRLYLMRWNARPLGCFFFSCLATLGVWPRTYRARTRHAKNTAVSPYPYTSATPRRANRTSLARARRSTRRDRRSPSETLNHHHHPSTHAHHRHARHATRTTRDAINIHDVPSPRELKNREPCPCYRVIVTSSRARMRSVDLGRWRCTGYRCTRPHHITRTFIRQSTSQYAPA